MQEESTLRTHRLWRYAVGAPPSGAQLVYEEPDRRFELELRVSRSERFLLLGASSETTLSVRCLPADEPEGALSWSA